MPFLVQLPYLGTKVHVSENGHVLDPNIENGDGGGDGFVGVNERLGLG